jgi:hypothetical protein
MVSLERFTINHISTKLNQINTEILLSHPKPFPNPHLLSHYQFKKRFVEILPNGSIRGGLPRMISSLVDFSFIRSLVAHRYSPFGPPCYDPPSIFLIDLFRYLDGCLDANEFLPILRDNDQGRAYRTYAGISLDRVPCEATLSNFRKRIGEFLYNEIFHVLVGIFHKLEMITFKILSHDGTLFPTWARYKGCTYFCQQCSHITVDNVIGKVKDRILYRLNHLTENSLGSECRVTTDCPSSKFPQDIPKPKIELFSCRLAFSDGSPTQEQLNTASFFGLKEELDREHLVINTLHSNVLGIDLETGNLTIRCPKFPRDTDARIGVRRDPQNPDRKQKIFGYNAVLSTSVELLLHIELPVAVTNIAGNAEEGNKLIVNRQQIAQHHSSQISIDIADAKYDELNNFDYIRKSGAIPIIDYNHRSEKLSKDDLKKRGYDENGWPFALCGLLCRPNGFDKDRGRAAFSCFKHCLALKYKALDDLQNRFDISSCPHLKNKTGFTKHMSIKDYPRLINEIPRGTKRYKDIKKLRSASERANSTLKEDIPILDKPRVLSIKRAGIAVQLSAIVLLLKRGFSFVAKVTSLLRRFRQTLDPKLKQLLNPPPIAKSIQDLIQRE